MTDQIGRIPAGGFRELGPINWVLAKSAARTVRAPKMHLFATLGQHKRLFLSMMPYSAVLLRGRLPIVDTELVILRVAHLRDSEYELQHHRWMGRRRGLDDQTQELIFAWPNATGAAGGLTDRQQTLLRATDEFILNRSISHRGVAAAVPSPRPASAHRILLAGRAIRLSGGHHVGPGDPVGLSGWSQVAVGHQEQRQ